MTKTDEIVICAGAICKIKKIDSQNSYYLLLFHATPLLMVEEEEEVVDDGNPLGAKPADANEPREPCPAPPPSGNPESLTNDEE